MAPPLVSASDLYPGIPDKRMPLPYRYLCGLEVIPETILLVLVAADRTLGALAGMSIFNHKSAKSPFQYKYRFIISGQVMAIINYTILATDAS